MLSLRPLLVSAFLLAFALALLASLFLLQRGDNVGLWIFGGSFLFALLALASFLVSGPVTTAPTFSAL